MRIKPRIIIYHTAKHAPKDPVKIQLPTSGVTSKDPAILKEITKEITITSTASMVYQTQFGNDSLGIWILS